MGETSNIEWTKATWNPWHGCHKISPGCAHCYMFKQKKQYGQDPNLVVRSKTKFSDPLKWDEGQLVFTCSWSDWFIEEADAWRDDAWDIVRRTRRHTYQILTKRIDRAAAHLPADWPLPNVWLGVSVENQKAADERIPILLQIPAAVRFLSVEPLLGPVDLSPYITPTCAACEVAAATGVGDDHGRTHTHSSIDWVIVGGESGPGARPMHPDWARSVRDQCVAAGVPFFFKQWGEWTDYAHAGAHGWEFTQESEGKRYGILTYPDGRKSAARFETRYPWPNESPSYGTCGPCMVRVGKKAAGRLLDGREWSEFPAPVAQEGM